MPSSNLTTTTITDAFTEVIEGFSGQVKETFDDGRRLFIRSLLPYVEEVRPRDRLQGGVALRATECDVCLAPYVFREVCRNGAIMAHALAAQHLVLKDEDTPEEKREVIRKAIAICCQQDVFATSIEEIRPSMDLEFDLALNMLPFLSQLPPSISADLLRHIFRQSVEQRRSSRYDFMNVVTSVARDTRDPEDRWRLEELGGGIGAGLLPTQPRLSPETPLPHRRPIEVG